MSQHRYEQLLVKRGQLNHSWEKFIAEDYNIDLLDHEEIYRTVMEGITQKRVDASIAKESVEKILRQLDLAIDGKIKRAAVVLFGKQMKSDFTQCWLKMARFAGTDKSADFIDNQQVYCNAFQMMEQADNFIRKHLSVASYFKEDQLERIDKPTLPVLAIREALVNAICHRDYKDSSGYISIAIFDDKLEILNNGTLPNQLKLDDLKVKHDSILRNQLIVKIFYLRSYIETWGTGTTRMINLCKSNKIPVPKFSERTGGILVTFPFAELIGRARKAAQLDLTIRQKEILQLLETLPMNSVQLAEKLKSSPAVRTVQEDLAILERLGLVRRQGKAKAMVWVFIKNQ